MVIFRKIEWGSLYGNPLCRVIAEAAALIAILAKTLLCAKIRSVVHFRTVNTVRAATLDFFTKEHDFVLSIHFLIFIIHEHEREIYC